MTSLSEIIRPGDLVAVTGFPEFYRALVPALDDAVGFTLADWDHKPDIYLGEAPPTDDAKPDDDRVYVFYVGAEARNGAHLRGLASVVLDATSTTAARVLKTAGAETSGLGLQLLDGKPVVTRLPQEAAR
jgi:hypothetical protein